LIIQSVLEPPSNTEGLGRGGRSNAVPWHLTRRSIPRQLFLCLCHWFEWWCRPV